jgi:hemerythrin-like metal-binding protein
MPIATWHHRFETGIDLVDAQHRSLFDAVNKLADSFKEGKVSDQVKENLDCLVEYALEHFQTEERFMRAAEYPRIAEHMVEHARLMEQVHNLQMDWMDGKAVTLDVTTFLVDWLKVHIEESDKAYADFMKEPPQK